MEDGSGVIVATGAENLSIIQFSDSDGEMKDPSHSHFVPGC